MRPRRWLKSVSQYKVDQRPIARLQNPESQVQCTSYMNRLLCYCLRIVLREAGQAQSSGGGESRGAENSGRTDEEDDSGSPISKSQKTTSDIAVMIDHRFLGARRRTVHMMKDARELYC
jgi:hypothetical protein